MPHITTGKLHSVDITTFDEKMESVSLSPFKTNARLTSVGLSHLPRKMTLNLMQFAPNG